MHLRGRFALTTAIRYSNDATQPLWKNTGSNKFSKSCENYKFLGILEAEPIKRVEMRKKKKEKCMPEEQEASQNHVLQQKYDQMDKHPGNFPFKIHHC